MQSFESQGLPTKYQFEHSHNNEMKILRKKWGSWAKKTCMSAYCFHYFYTGYNWINPIVSEKYSQEGDGGSDRETPTPRFQAPPERFLRKGSDNLWKLGPLPDLGAVLNADIGIALHTYVTQQWSKSILILLEL